MLDRLYISEGHQQIVHATMKKEVGQIFAVLFQLDLQFQAQRLPAMKYSSIESFS